MNKKHRQRIRLGMAILCSFCAVTGRSPAQESSSKKVIFADESAKLGLNLANEPACWIDVDNDGWVDIICGGVYWHNDHGKGFTKMQEGLGSVVAADYDNDGYPDLFSYTQMKLYHNEGGKNFAEAPLPALPKTLSVGACWGDFNNDGCVDLYVGGYEDWDKDITFPSMILMNRGGKSFEMTWNDNHYRTRGVTACDFDRKNGIDVYASNYRLQPNELWVNNGQGVFKDEATKYNVVGASPGFDGGHTIGSAWGDFDNDGNIDLFVGNFAHVDQRGDQPKSRFLRNPGVADTPFEDMGTCGISYQESYASPAAGDYDNDGHLDLYFTTVYPVASFHTPNHPILFRQIGRFEFKDESASANLSDLPPTYQAAWADFNNDGALDLLTAGKLYANQGSGLRWLEVKLTGDGKLVNTSAIGAQVRVRLGKEILTRQVEAGTGQGNQNDLTLHFGLGSHATPVDLEIFWPNGKVQNIRDVHTNQKISILFKS